MQLGFKEGNSYSHYLLIEQAITALKQSGFAFLVVQVIFLRMTM